MNAFLSKLFRAFFVIIFSLGCIFPDHQSIAEVVSSSTSSSAHFPKNLSVLDQLKQLKLPGATISRTKEGEKKDSLIILIQDLHCQEEAQINIAKTLEAFQKELGLKNVLMEGAEGEFDLELLKAFPDHKVRDKVGLKFVKEGYLTGAEYAALRSGLQNSLDLYGVEKSDLYIENLKAFLKVRQMAKEFSRSLEKMNSQIKMLVEGKYSEEMKKLLKLQNALKENDVKLDEVLMQLERLLEQHGQKLDGNLKQMLEVLRTAKVIQSKKVQLDLKKLLDDLSHRLKNEELKSMVKWSLEYRLGRMGILEYLTQLKEAYERDSRVSLEKNYPTLSDYYQLQVRQEKLKSESVYEELDQKINVLMSEFAKDSSVVEEEKSVREWGWIKDLIALKATRKELEEIQRGFNGSSINTFGDDNNFSSLINESLHFYELALNRDQVMTQNTLEKLQVRATQNASRITVLITGGFHTEGIEKILDEKGISYAVLIPQMHGKVDDNIYENRMQGPYDFENTEFSQKKLTSHRRTENGRWTLTPAALYGRILEKIIAGGTYTQKDEEILVSIWMNVQGTIKDTLDQWVSALDKLSLKQVESLIGSLKKSHPNTIVTQFFIELEELRGTTGIAAEITQKLVEKYAKDQPGLLKLAQVWVKKQSKQDGSRVLPRPPRAVFLSSWWMAAILFLGACFRPSIAIQSSGEISEQDQDEYDRGMTLLGDIARRVDVYGDRSERRPENVREEDVLQLQRYIANTDDAFVARMLRKRAIEVLRMMLEFFEIASMEETIPRAWITPSLFRAIVTIFTLLNQEDSIYADAGVLLNRLGRISPERFQPNDTTILERFLERYLPDNMTNGLVYSTTISQIILLVQRLCDVRPDLIRPSLVAAFEAVLTREYTPGLACAPIVQGFRSIQQLNANLIRPDSPAQAALSLPENTVHHPFPHYQIYLDSHFRDLTRNMSVENQHSIALCVYRLLRRYNIEIISDNINRAVHLILEERRQLAQRVVLGPGRKVINIFHSEQDPTEIMRIETDARVSPESISRPFRGGQDKQAALEAIRNSRGPITIIFDGHGYSNLLALDDQTEITPQEMAQALIARGDLGGVIFINNSCFSYNFNVHLMTLISQAQVPTDSNLPILVSTSSFDQSANGFFLPALQAVHRPHQSLMFGELFQMETRMNAPVIIQGLETPPLIYNDMTILIEISFERIQRAFPHLSLTNSIPVSSQIIGGPYGHPRNIPVLPLPARALEVSTVSPASGLQNQNDRGVQSQVEQNAGMAAKVPGSKGDKHAVPIDPATGEPIDLTNEPLLEIPQGVRALIEKIVKTQDSDLIDKRHAPPSYGKDRHEKYRELLKALQVVLQSGTVKVHISDKLDKDVQATRQVKDNVVHVVIHHDYYEKIKSLSPEGQAEEILSLMTHEFGEQYEKGETPVWLDERLTFVHPEMVCGVEAFIRWSLSGGQEFIPLRVQRHIQDCITRNDQEKLDQLRRKYTYDEETYGLNPTVKEISEGFSVELTKSLPQLSSEPGAEKAKALIGPDILNAFAVLNGHQPVSVFYAEGDSKSNYEVLNKSLAGRADDEYVVIVSVIRNEEGREEYAVVADKVFNLKANRVGLIGGKLDLNAFEFIFNFTVQERDKDIYVHLSNISLSEQLQGQKLMSKVFDQWKSFLQQKYGSVVVSTNDMSGGATAHLFEARLGGRPAVAGETNHLSEALGVHWQELGATTTYIGWVYPVEIETLIQKLVDAHLPQATGEESDQLRKNLTRSYLALVQSAKEMAEKVQRAELEAQLREAQAKERDALESSATAPGGDDPYGVLTVELALGIQSLREGTSELISGMNALKNISGPQDNDQIGWTKTEQVDIEEVTKNKLGDNPKVETQTVAGEEVSFYTVEFKEISEPVEISKTPKPSDSINHFAWERNLHNAFHFPDVEEKPSVGKISYVYISENVARDSDLLAFSRRHEVLEIFIRRKWGDKIRKDLAAGKWPDFKKVENVIHILAWAMQIAENQENPQWRKAEDLKFIVQQFAKMNLKQLRSITTGDRSIHEQLRKEYLNDILSPKQLENIGKFEQSVKDYANAEIQKRPIPADLFKKDSAIYEAALAVQKFQFLRGAPPSFSPDGRRLKVVYADRTIEIIDSRTGKSLNLPIRENVNSTEFSPDSSKLLVQYQDATVEIIDLDTEQVLNLPIDRRVDSANFSPDGQRLIVKYQNRTAKVISLNRDNPSDFLIDGGVVSASFSPDNTKLIVQYYGQTVKVFDVATGQSLNLRIRGNVESVSFSPDGEKLLVQYQNRFVEILYLKTGQSLRFPRGIKVDSAVFSPSGREVIGYDGRNISCLIDCNTGKDLSPFLGSDVAALLFSPDGKRVIVRAHKGAVKILGSLEDQEGYQDLNFSLGYNIATAHFSPDGKRLLVRYKDRTFQLFDSSTGKPLNISIGHEVESVSFSPDGKLLKVQYEDNTILMFNVMTGQVLRLPITSKVGNCTFSSNGKKLMVQYLDHTVAVIDLDSFENNIYLKRACEQWGHIAIFGLEILSRFILQGVIQDDVSFEKEYQFLLSQIDILKQSLSEIEAQELKALLLDSDWLSRLIQKEKDVHDIFSFYVKLIQLNKNQGLAVLAWAVENPELESWLLDEFVHAEDIKTFSEYLITQGQKLLKEGFDPNNRISQFLVWIALREIGVTLDWKTFKLIMKDFERFEEKVPGYFQSLFSEEVLLDLSWREKGGFDPKNFLHIMAGYQQVIKLSYGGKVPSFEEYLPMVYDYAREGDRLTEESINNSQERAELYYLAWEAYEMKKRLIDPVIARAKELGKKVVVVENLSYGAVALSPIKDLLKNQGVDVWSTKVGSTEAHSHPDILNPNLFSQEQLKFLVEEEPIVIVVDGSFSLDRKRTGAVPHIPDARVGYANFFARLTKTLSPESEVEKVFGLKYPLGQMGDRPSAYIEQNQQLEQKIRNVSERKNEPYQMYYWYGGNLDLCLREEEEARAMPEELDLRRNESLQNAIRGPTLIFVESAIEAEAVPPKIYDLAGQIEHRPGSFDDQKHFKIFKDLKFTPYGPRPNKAYRDFSRQAFRQVVSALEGGETVFTSGSGFDMMLLDLDATLADTLKPIQNDMVLALIKQLESGVQIGILTAQSLQEVQENLLRPLINFLRAQDVKDKTFLKNLHLFPSQGACGMGLNVDGTVASFYYTYDFESKQEKQSTIEIVRGSIQDEADVRLRDRDSVVRLDGINQRDEVKEKLQRAFTEAGLNLVVLERGDRSLEILLPGVSKKLAVDWMMEKFHPEPSRVLVISDNLYEGGADESMILEGARNISVGERAGKGVEHMEGGWTRTLGILETVEREAALRGQRISEEGIGALKDPGPNDGNGASLNEKEQKIVLDEAQKRAGSEATCLIDGVEIKFQVMIYDNDEKTQDAIGQIAREKKLNHAFHLPNPDPAKKTYYIFVSKNAGDHQPLYEQHELSEIFAEMKYGPEVYALEKAKKLPKGYTAHRLFHLFAWANDLRMSESPELFLLSFGEGAYRETTVKARSIEELKIFMETYINNMSFDLALDMLTEDRSMQDAWATRCFGVEIGKLFIEFEQSVQEMLAKRLACHYQEGTRPVMGKIPSWQSISSGRAVVNAGIGLYQAAIDYLPSGVLRNGMAASVKELDLKPIAREEQAEKFSKKTLKSFERSGRKVSSAFEEVCKRAPQQGYLIFKQIGPYGEDASHVHCYEAIEIATGNIVAMNAVADKDSFSWSPRSLDRKIQMNFEEWWASIPPTQEERLKAFVTLLYAIVLQGNYLYENGLKLTGFDPLSDITILRGLGGDQFIINPNKIVPREESTGIAFSSSANFSEIFRSLLFQTLYGSRNLWPEENGGLDAKIKEVYGENAEKFLVFVTGVLSLSSGKSKASKYVPGQEKLAVKIILEELVDSKALAEIEAFGGKVQPLPEVKKEEPAKDGETMTFEAWRASLFPLDKTKRYVAYVTVLYTVMFKINQCYKEGFVLADGFDLWEDISFKREGGKTKIIINPKKIVLLAPHQRALYPTNMFKKVYPALLLYTLYSKNSSIPDEKDITSVSEDFYGVALTLKEKSVEERLILARQALLALDPQSVIDIEGPECKLPLPAWAKWLRESPSISREEKFKRMVGLMAKIFYRKVRVSRGDVGSLLMTLDGEPISAEGGDMDFSERSDLGKELCCERILSFILGRENTDYHSTFSDVDRNIFSLEDWKRLEFLLPRVTIWFRGVSPEEVLSGRPTSYSGIYQMFKPSRDVIDGRIRIDKDFWERLSDLMQEVDPKARARLVEESKSTPVSRLKDIGEPGPEDTDRKVSEQDIQVFIKNAQGRTESKEQQVLDQKISYQLVIYDDSEKTKDPIGKLAKEKGLKNAFHFPAAQAGGVNYIFVSKKALHEDPAQNQQAFYEWHEVSEIYIRARFQDDIKASIDREEIPSDFTLERIIHILAWALDIELAMTQAKGNFGGESQAYRDLKTTAGRSLEDLLKFIDAQISQRPFESLPELLNEDRREQARIIAKFLSKHAFDNYREIQDNFRVRVAKRISEFYENGWKVPPPTRLAKARALIWEPTVDQNRAWQIKYLVDATLQTMAGKGSKERDELMSLYPELVKSGYAPIACLGSMGSLAYRVVNLKTGALEFVMRTPPQDAKRWPIFQVVEKIVYDEDLTSLKNWFLEIPKEERAKKLLSLLYRLSLRVEPLGNENGKKLRANEVRVDKEGNPYYEGDIPHPESFRTIFADLLYDGNPPESFERSDLEARIKEVFGETFTVIPPEGVLGDEGPSAISVRYMDVFEGYYFTNQILLCLVDKWHYRAVEGDERKVNLPPPGYKFPPYCQLLRGMLEWVAPSLADNIDQRFFYVGEAKKGAVTQSFSQGMISNETVGEDLNSTLAGVNPTRETQVVEKTVSVMFNQLDELAAKGKEATSLDQALKNYTTTDAYQKHLSDEVKEVLKTMRLVALGDRAFAALGNAKGNEDGISFAHMGYTGREEERLPSIYIGRDTLEYLAQERPELLNILLRIEVGRHRWRSENDFAEDERSTKEAAEVAGVTPLELEELNKALAKALAIQLLNIKKLDVTRLAETVKTAAFQIEGKPQRMVMDGQDIGMLNFYWVEAVAEVIDEKLKDLEEGEEKERVRKARDEIKNVIKLLPPISLDSHIIDRYRRKEYIESRA